MKRTLWMIILLAACVSLGVVVQRWNVERPNRTVEIVYDLPGLLEVSATTGLDLDRIIADLHSAGVETIAVQPASIGDILLTGDVVPADIRSQLPGHIPDLAKLLTLPVAFQEEQFEWVQSAGLKTAPKINTAPWNVEPIWSAYQPELLIVSGQGMMDLTELELSGARLALVEFSTPQIRPADPGSMVRLHGISAPEMLVLSQERILNRYLRAVRERNIRVLYVRPFVHGEDSWDRSLDLLKALGEKLEKAGFPLGQARPFSPWSPHGIWTALAAVGIWAAALLYAWGLLAEWRKILPWGALVALAANLVLLFLSPLLAKQVLALVAAIVFPCLALQWGMMAKTCWQRYWFTAAISMLGAVFVVTVLSGTEFLLKLQEFRGVKVMHAVPVALALYTLARPLKSWLDKNVPIRYLVLAAFVGLAGVFYILRTGNFGLPVIGLEVKAREFLENLLLVRPRTKELFLGHPALYFAAQSQQPQRSWWLPVAVIGQISLVNTFTHIHTFLGVSLLRTLYGLVFGYLLGWLAWKVFQWGKRWWERDHGFRILRFP